MLGTGTSNSVAWVCFRSSVEELFGQFQLFSNSAILGASLETTLRCHLVKFVKLAFAILCVGNSLADNIDFKISHKNFL